MPTSETVRIPSHGDELDATLTVPDGAQSIVVLGHGLGAVRAMGLDAYAEFQRSREKEVLGPGIAFPMVQKLLALNAGASPESPRVEVVLLSRNSSDTGLRIFNSIRHYGLGIVRAVFTSGAETWPYIKPFGAQLFLSANPASVRSALEHGFAAATILPAKAYEPSHPQLRIAFDGDAVIFGDESERVSQEFAKWVRRCLSWVRRRTKRIHDYREQHPNLPNPGRLLNSIYAFPDAYAEVESGRHHFVIT